MSKIQEFIDNNTPTRFYKIIRKYSFGVNKYKVEVRILRDE